MPTLDFKGKNYVYSHHLSVPFRALEVDADKSKPLNGEKPTMDDNLIIQGDNLHALKALLPKYAGKIKCIYIDPPYNTGNEGWCYSDNVNSPVMREWLKDNANPVDKEDLERHDKWLCMMWPRLQLLRELLSDDGVIFISIDEIEICKLRLLMDEIYGENNFIEQIIWQNRVSPANDAKWFSSDHEYIITYAKNKDKWFPKKSKRTDKQNSYYTNPDKDNRGKWNSAAYTCNKNKDERPNLYYPLINPNTNEEVWPNENAVWAYSKETHLKHVEENILYWGKDGKSNSPRK
jgi:adenine-specific DNA-methyltransferase